MAKLITGLLVLACLVGAGFYVTSEYFQSKVNQEWKDLTTWTPEKIREDPAGYLRFALDEFNKIEGNLKDRKLALKIKQEDAEGKLRLAKAELPKFIDTLDDLKVDYRKGEETGTYVISASPDKKEYSQDAMRRLILDGDLQVRKAERDVRTYTTYIAKVESEIGRTERALEDLREKRSEVEKQLEYVKLDQSIKNLESLSSKVNAVLNTTRAIREEKPESIRFEDVVRQNSKNQLEKGEADRFDRIMKGN